jgi:hypothetical protein
MGESFLITEGLDKAARRPNRLRSNSLQIVPLTESTEHLLEREGPDEVAATGTIETPWKRMKSASPPARA